MAGRHFAPLLTLLVGFTCCCMLTFGCSKDSVTLSDGDAVQLLLETDTFVLDFADSTAVHSISAGELTLDYFGSDSLDIAPGYLLVARNARVLLREVLALSTTEIPGETVGQGGQQVILPDTLRYTLETNEATLADVILNGQIRWQQSLNPFSAYQDSAAYFDGSALPGLAMTASGLLFTEVALVDSTINGTRLRATLPSGLLHFTPLMDFFAQFLLDAGVNDTYTRLRGNLDVEVDLEVDVSDSITFVREIPLFDPIPFTTYVIEDTGGLPLAMDVAYGVVATLEVACSGPVTVQTRLEETVAIELGGRYRTTDDWTDMWEADATVADYGLSYNVDEDIELRLTLRPYFETRVHGGAGATIRTAVTAQLSGTATEVPWAWSLSQGVGGQWSNDGSRLDDRIGESSGNVVITLETVASDGAGSGIDVTPPARIGDLTRAAIDSSSVTLTWSAPGDNGLEGAASSYDVRYSTWDQILYQWEHSPQAGTEPIPSASGQTDSLTVSGLLPGTTYYFAMRSVDAAGNEATTSNVVIARTLGQNVNAPVTVFVSAGTFQMGDGIAPCGIKERTVTLTRDFYIGQYEVTNLEYLQLLQWAYDGQLVLVDGTHVRDAQGSGRLLLDMTTDDCEIWFDPESELFALRQSSFAQADAYPDGYDPADHPVKRVTWFGAVSYCNWLSLTRGLAPVYDPHTWTVPPGRTVYETEGFRLPTDAEWEYVAQFDSSFAYPWGRAEPTCERANCRVDNLWCLRWTRAVGSLPAGAQTHHEADIYDLAGNVWEWCNDLWLCDLGSSAVTDPTGPTNGDKRVLRGGSWSSEPEMCRSAARNDFASPAYPSFLVGFRPARTVTPK